jgi:hypothetical protein
MLEIHPDPAWQNVSVLVALLIALIGGLRWYFRVRKQRRDVENVFSAQAPPPIASVRRVPRQSIEQQAHLLLGAIYELADGSPGQWVAGAEAAERASIPFTMQDYDPLFRYLRQSELISTHNLVHNEVCKLTPKGVRAAEQMVAS